MSSRMMMSELPDVDESKQLFICRAVPKGTEVSIGEKGGGISKILKRKIDSYFGHRMYELCRYRKRARDIYIYINALSL
jgi:hypothetical protein